MIRLLAIEVGTEEILARAYRSGLGSFEELIPSLKKGGEGEPEERCYDSSSGLRGRGEDFFFMRGCRSSGVGMSLTTLMPEVGRLKSPAKPILCIFDNPKSVYY
jgi:hypothetical protein